MQSFLLQLLAHRTYEDAINQGRPMQRDAPPAAMRTRRAARRRSDDGLGAPERRS